MLVVQLANSLPYPFILLNLLRDEGLPRKINARTGGPYHYHVINSDTGLLPSGQIFFLGGGPASWASTKQRIRNDCYTHTIY
jgi:hypothetical protein